MDTRQGNKRSSSPSLGRSDSYKRLRNDNYSSRNGPSPRLSSDTASLSTHPANSSADRPLATFPLHPLDRFQTRCAQYQQPTEVGYFSYNEKREMTLQSDAELKWYYEPDLKACDLSDGFPDRYITRDPVPERLDALLKCLQNVNKLAEESGKMAVAPNFCTWRGIMTKILCTPYSRDEWELGVTRYKDTIYIEEHESDEKRQHAFGASERDKLMSYWGYKFESLSTIDKLPSTLTGPDDEALRRRKEECVNTNVQYCSVVRTRLGSNVLVMGAEVDCLVADAKPPNNPQSAYAELKTNRIISNERQQKSFERHKLLKIWAQSFLPGIPRIIIGYRTDSGHIQHIQHLKTMDIPRMVRGTQPNIWDATVCINFANGLLEFLKGVVVEDDPDVVYTVRFGKPFGEVRVLKREKGKVGLEGVFVPDWYRT
ncbi:hypothetical protein SpCBS45565_g06387 [Spizellomyces sp. 'palustris']|nr:hypothetical protein SpCBS45565_g06387 [Spizellomyces sp. 'palustris']